MINYNFHQHSIFSDGAYPPEDYVKKAIELGFSAMGFTEHSPLPFENPFSLKEENVNDYINTIDELKVLYNGKIKLYRALEMDFIPGISNDFNYWKNKCSTDYLIGSVHLVAPPGTDELWFTDGPNHDIYDKGLNEFFGGDIRLAVRTYYHQVNQMIETQSFDVLGHFDKIKMHNQNRFFTEDEPWYQSLVDECLDLVKQKNLIVEVNTRGIYKKRSKTLFPDDMALEKVRKLKLPIIISSDAHQPNELNLGFSETKLKLIDMGFKEVMFFDGNAWVAHKL
jgi:histidinol-phosphatase (PHP family)